MKSGKAPGIDSITADLLKVDSDTTVQDQHEVFNKIWDSGRKCSRGLAQRAYHQASQERRFDELRELERYHLMSIVAKVSKSPD